MNARSMKIIASKKPRNMFPNGSLLQPPISPQLNIPTNAISIIVRMAIAIAAAVLSLAGS
jgi:hypothetical protein